MWKSAIFGGFLAAFRDFVGALDAHASIPLYQLLPKLVCGLVPAFFVYVPLHELLHAAGCLLFGGSVERIEISPLFGGRILAGLTPMVSPDTKYAGRLAQFDVGGSDLVFLATDFAPYVLTILVGIPLFRALTHAPNAWLLGPAAVLAMAPWMSITGDYYEMGSILATRLAGGAGADFAALRSDDMLSLISTVWSAARPAGPGGSWGSALTASVIAASFFLGSVLASLTYFLGVSVSLALGRLRRPKGKAQKR